MMLQHPNLTAASHHQPCLRVSKTLTCPRVPSTRHGAHARVVNLHASADPEAQWSQWAASVAQAPLAQPAVTTAAPAQQQQPQLVRSRVLKNRKGLFRIRHLQDADLMPVADLQAASFHEALPLKPLDQMAYTMFKAEVLSAVQKKTKVLAEDGFTILVVESCSPTATSAWPAQGGRGLLGAGLWYGDQQQAAAGARADSAAAHSSSNSSASGNSIIGVIEIGVQDERDVLQHMPKGLETYAYISSMAVAAHARRCGIGAALLHAAEQQALLWGQQLLALHVHDGNEAAIKLYESHGLCSHAADPAWRKYVGGKVRQLMIKWL